MSNFRPSEKSYAANYPNKIFAAELRYFLRPRLTRCLSLKALPLIILLLGSTLSSCVVATPVPSGRATPLPMMGKSTRSAPDLKAKVDQLVNEVLGSQPGGVWYKSSRVEHYRLIADNAMIKFPQVSISFGNSISGIFNVKEARNVTMKLFEAYGIPLEAQVSIEGDGYEFTADGFNKELNVGFEIRASKDAWLGWDSQEAEKEVGSSFLGDSELPALEKDVNLDKIDVFVCNPYLNYDGDHKMAMSYYLASVIDYLNWIHGDRAIDYQRVLQETRNPAEDWSSYRKAKIKTLWEWSAIDAARPWTVDKGAIGTKVENGLPVTLEPGASAIYRPTEEIPYGLDATPMWSEVRLSMTLADPDGVPADFDLSLNGDSRTRFSYFPEGKSVFHFNPDGPVAEENRTLESLSITNVNRFPITIYVATVDACGYDFTLRTKSTVTSETK